MHRTGLPMYLYYNTEFPECGDGTLFHFTKYENFEKIFESLTLRPSSFENLNDLNEGNVGNMDMSKNFWVMYRAGKYIKERCHILSFSQNYDYDGWVQEGTNHPAMWAHYAENSKGVCIVIDKDTFIKKNQAIFDRYFYKFENVEYDFFNTPNDDKINYNATTPEDFIKDNWKTLFFLKHKDWENECEHRLFVMDYSGDFSIDRCIKYIVLGSKIIEEYPGTQIKKILDKVVDPSSICYHKFGPHSFATTSYNNHGYFTSEISGQIMEIVRANISDEKYASYYKWLKDEQGYLI